uniref:Ankyrin repeat and KH domain containing 1 n=1 Tax=Anser cygnoides TaxID=8845 RepID=A0A8B9DWC7_ANSCY
MTSVWLSLIPAFYATSSCSSLFWWLTVESFILDQEDLDNPVLKTTSELFLSSAAEGADLRTVDPETQARLEALLEAAGIGKLSTADGKAFADPEVLRRLTSSVSCALDEAAAALTRMRAENNHNAGQVDNRSLAEACSDGDVNAVRKLLDEGRSVNEHTEEGESLLCLACSAGYYELAQVSKRLLLVMYLVLFRVLKTKFSVLGLGNGKDLRANFFSAGNTALTYACAGGFVDIVKVLLKAGANIEDHNENGHTPLMEAASAGHVEVARVLLEYGAGINTHSNEFKESALTLACYKGHLDMVRFLLEAGADQEHKTDEMHTALMEACMDGHVEVARLLLDSGAQVNMPADSFESPLTLAACGGHVELAALLIERGANLEEVNDEGYTPLMEAAREGHEEMVALLLAQGANINAQTEETQETALTLACCGGFSEVADFLIKAGADIELGCSTPLMEAAQEGHLELVKYLLAAGANVHATTATGDTALTYACENGHTDVADVLLQAGADLDKQEDLKKTILEGIETGKHQVRLAFDACKLQPQDTQPQDTC